MNEDPLTEIANRCLRALPIGDQHVIYSQTRTGELVAFEFLWSDGRPYKVVVSEAEGVGVENMEYPPRARA